MAGCRVKVQLTRLARIALGVVLLVVVVRASGGGSLLRSLLANAWVISLFLVQTGIGAVVEAKRLAILLGAQGVQLRMPNGLRLVAAAASFTYAVPGGTGGDLVKLYYLASDRRGRGVEVATVLLVDRAIGLFALLCVALILALIAGVARGGTVVAWAVGLAFGGMLLEAAVMALAWSRRFRGSGLYRFLTARAPLAPYWRRLFDAAYEFRNHRGRVMLAVALSVVGQSLLAGAFGMAGIVLLGGAPAVLTGALGLLGLVANALPVTPAGLGVGEAAFQTLFAAAGYVGGAQLILAWRLGMVPLAITGAILYAVGLRHRGGPLTALADSPPVP